MGGGLGGSFGGTKGSNGSFKETLDHISNILAAASFIPGADTITNAISIPVDLARGDWVSAVLDLAGIVPVFGEAADVAKTGDKIIDGVKAADKATDSAKIAKKVKYPGNNPSKSPGKGFEWRGKSSPKDGKGNWYNPKTGEKWNSDLGHGDPIGPHWDYTDKNGNKFRVFPDGRVEKK